VGRSKGSSEREGKEKEYEGIKLQQSSVAFCNTLLVLNKSCSKMVSLAGDSTNGEQ
jgi:hypothetical protein